MEVIKEIDFEGFLLLQANMIPKKLVLWLVHNINNCSYSLPLAHDRMKVAKHDVHMTLGVPKGPLEGQDRNLKLGFGRGYLEDFLDKTIVSYEEGEINKEECYNKSVEAKAKVKDQTGISKVKDGKMTSNIIITSSWLLEKVMIELEELLLGGHVPLKRVRKAVVELTSDALITDTTKKSKNRTPVLLQDSYESEGFIMVSQEEKQALPKGVVLVNSKPNIPITEVQVLNFDVEVVLMRGIMSFTH
ncbi:hypothetical protein Cgig2_033996 [Carnegiea gigantea]|uniref:Uncharacterized protein n=1 Tax=Carnegiea gigantea TaxID=171969 RepID=A0A9Q1GRS0_9CARY|nr:hypothetical protein Cgig2_033996 [Carnegiea gigantea]